MAIRSVAKQSAHDDVVRAVGQVYRSSGKRVWLNPDGEKNREWAGFFIDVIATAPTLPDRAWVVEVETDDSVCAAEAQSQWARYGDSYTAWCLAVPEGQEETARSLVREHDVRNCRIASWFRLPSGQYAFRGLPGLGTLDGSVKPGTRQVRGRQERSARAREV
jgi:hypothetical protein